MHSRKKMSLEVFDEYLSAVLNLQNKTVELIVNFNIYQT